MLAEATKTAEKMLDEFGLKAVALAHPFSLSHGEQRRLSVAAMLVLGQQGLLLDELPFYRARGRSLQALRGSAVVTAGAAAGALKDVLVGEDGQIERLVVDGPAGELRVRVDAAVKIHERRAPAA